MECWAFCDHRVASPPPLESTPPEQPSSVVDIPFRTTPLQLLHCGQAASTLCSTASSHLLSRLPSSTVQNGMPDCRQQCTANNNNATPSHKAIFDVRPLSIASYADTSGTRALPSSRLTSHRSRSAQTSFNHPLCPLSPCGFIRSPYRDSGKERLEMPLLLITILYPRY